MLKLTNPRLRKSNVMLDSFGSCISNTPKEFSRTPEMSFSKVVSQPGMFFEKAEGTVSFKQLKGFAHAQRRRKLHKQVNVVDSDMQFVDFASLPTSNLSQKEFAIHSEPIKLEGVFGIFNFPHEVECVLSEAVLPRFEIHFLSPKSAKRKKAHANLNVYFEEPSISALLNSQTKELNLLEDGDSSLL